MNATQSHVTPEFLDSQGLSQTFPERFFSKVEFTDSCWIWTAYTMPAGYGMIGTGIRNNGMILAHRASWLLHFGPIPDGIWVLHDCPGGDNPSCVNPAHLWLGTDADNAADAKAKGRTWITPLGYFAGDKSGMAKLTWEQVRQIREKYRPFRVSTIELGHRFGVTSATISRIAKNLSWVDASYKTNGKFHRILSDEQQEAIKTAYRSGALQYELAKQYGVSKQLISVIAGTHRKP